MMIIEFGYAVFSRIKGKNDFLNEISENDLQMLVPGFAYHTTVYCFQIINWFAKDR